MRTGKRDVTILFRLTTEDSIDQPEDESWKQKVLSKSGDLVGKSEHVRVVYNRIITLELGMILRYVELRRSFVEKVDTM